MCPGRRQPETCVCPGLRTDWGFPIWTGRDLLGQGLVRRKRKARGGEGTHALLLSVPAAARGAVPSSRQPALLRAVLAGEQELRDGTDHAQEVLEQGKVLDQSVPVGGRLPKVTARK